MNPFWLIFFKWVGKKHHLESHLKPYAYTANCHMVLSVKPPGFGPTEVLPSNVWAFEGLCWDLKFLGFLRGFLCGHFLNGVSWGCTWEFWWIDWFSFGDASMKWLFWMDPFNKNHMKWQHPKDFPDFFQRKQTNKMSRMFSFSKADPQEIISELHLKYGGTSFNSFSLMCGPTWFVNKFEGCSSIVPLSRTPWKINGWNLQPSPKKKGKWSEPNLHDEMVHVNLPGWNCWFLCFFGGQLELLEVFLSTENGGNV